MALAIRQVLAGAAALALAMVLGACIIAQSSSDVPRLPETRPTIVHPEVVPPAGAILTRWPPSFVVPVELSDPKATFAYAVFVDYNAFTGDGRIAGDDNVLSDPQSLATRVRTLEIAIPQDLQPADDRCHVIEVVVALSFNANGGKNAHTPAAPGGDSVSWIYNPGGGPSGCPTLDAGIEASFVDAEGGL